MTNGRDLYENSDLDIEDESARIQRRAYEIWEEEGRPDGRALDHWAQAEQEVRASRPAPMRLAEGEISVLSESD